VTIGANTFRGDGARYAVHVEIDDVVADFTLTAEVAPWRPETGHTFFGPAEEHFIAWLPVVARGSVDAVITVDGDTRTSTGTGYHDHDWGNAAPRKVLDHWYWGRARIGAYTVVTLMFVSHDDYRNAPLPAVMIAKGGQIVASAVGADQVDFTGERPTTQDQTGVPFAKTLQYRVVAGDSTFVVTFDHRRDAYTLDFGAAGAYLRFSGDVSIEHRDGTGSSTESATALWELLSFGHRRGDGSGAATTEPGTVVSGHQA
nr:hydroxyneurosporene dehydrogenase [Actinomycetota bacterium]